MIRDYRPLLLALMLVGSVLTAILKLLPEAP
jgi:hypothetical protein